MDELIRAKLHEALDVEPPDPRLRARVMSSLPAHERLGGRHSRPALEWASGIIAVLLALAVVMSLLYVRGGLFPSSQPTPHAKSRAQSGMVSPTTGWIFSRQSGYLIRTTDGGQRWLDVTPPAYVVSAEPEGQFFLDTNHGWLAETVADNLKATPSGKTITVAASLFVFSTADGGRHWKRGAPISALGMDREPGAVSLFFLDSRHGWMLMDVCCGPELYRVYATGDGGLSWGLASSIPENCIGTPHPFRHLTFSSLTTGWLTTPCVSDPLLVTHDAGKSWHSQSLPIVAMPNISKMPGGGSDVSDAAVFVDQLHGVLLMTGNAGYQLLRTADGGATWAVRALPSGAQVSVDFVDPDHGWVADLEPVGLALSLYMTDDGALTWKRVQSDLILATNGVGSIDSVYFVDEMNGFATRAIASANPELWKTNDGGHTWTLAGPIKLSA